MIITIIFTTLLFVLLTPSVLVRLPQKGNKYTVAFVHGLLFAIIYHFTHKFVKNMNHTDNFTLYKDASCNYGGYGHNPPPPPTPAPKPSYNLIPNEKSGPLYYKAPGSTKCQGPLTFA